MSPASRPFLDRQLRIFVGPASAAKLQRLGLETVGDLLNHLPRRITHHGALAPIGRLPIGEHVTVSGRIVSATARTTRAGGQLFTAVVTDGTLHLDLTFFAKSRGPVFRWEKELRPGRTGMFSGVAGYYNKRLQLTHPAYEMFDDDVSPDELRRLAQAPIPIYPAAAGVESWAIRTSLATVLGPMSEEDVPDPLPIELRAMRGLPTRLTAYRQVHEPATDAEYFAGLERFRFEEALLTQIALVQRRAEVARTPAVARPVRAGGLLDAFDAALPFTLTDGQREVGEQLAADLAEPHPMHRLLQGEVGSGKTLVALRAMLQVVDAGGQAALLAPTEVLAGQHLRTIRALLGPLGEEGLMAAGGPNVAVRLLTGALGAPARKQALLDAASGAAGIVIGTHALLSDPVQFADLGFVVVDEQHRFGVEQRDALRAKGASPPHTLVMTATPIPRTIAMTVFGDLDVSTLAELPAGRPGTETHLVPADRPAWVARCWSRIREEVDAGRRAYVVCPAIDAAPAPDDPPAPADEPEGGSDDGGEPVRPRASVTATLEQLRSEPALAGIGIGMMTGRMSSEEKDRAMADFVSGRTPVLVATTVIEVGVDVPDASVMVVLDADRFGLTQLHQLRGRVGRGAQPGLCLLVSWALATGDDGASPSLARRRLEALAETSDGFELAEKDLSLRHEGDVLGESQTGSSSLKVLRVITDARLIGEARAAAEELVAADPSLESHPLLAAAVARALADRADYVAKN